ncbi:MAG: PolC-type DNA polymerase III [Firmicutes bacterium]|nr:PolC-type DNA polymerase III [Bacillota bacterium]
MEELILRYINAQELGFPENTSPDLYLNNANFNETLGVLDLNMTSNFVVPSYILDVVRSSVMDKIPDVKEVNFNFKYDNMVELKQTVRAVPLNEKGIMKIKDLRRSDTPVEIEGQVLYKEVRKLKSGRSLLILHVTDFTETIAVKKFLGTKQALTLPDEIHEGCFVAASGTVQQDNFEDSNVFMAKKVGYIGEADFKKRMDTAPEKRIELHAHTNMSKMDGLVTPKELVARAAEWGHEAVAITDHGVVQSFPDAMNAGKKKGIKILYGMEGYLVNDIDESAPIYLDDEFVVFDLETTGFSPTANEIIEIGAVRVKGRKILDEFHSFVKPSEEIPENITELTDITNEMVADADPVSAVLPRFIEFAGNAVMVAHNSAFDMSFIKMNASRLEIPFENRDVDTLYLSRVLLPELKRHRLDAVAKHFSINQEHHHRADDDARTTATILLKFFEIMENAGVQNINEASRVNCVGIDYKSKDTNHIILFAQNKTGLKNLYKLVSLSHLEYFYKKPRIPKSVLMKHREGIIVGGACQDGEVFQSVLNGRKYEDCLEIAKFYDYLELQPRSNNEFLIENGKIADENGLIKINKTIVDMAKDLGIPAVATSDVHYMEPEDSIYRKIIMKGQGFKDVEGDNGLYFRTTSEMLDEFSYLGEEDAYNAVIANPKKIADSIEVFDPVPKEKYPPKIENSDADLRRLCYDKAHSIYGDPLPEIVEKRLERELNSIISNGYAVMYIIAHKLVAKSMSDGYVVGSRGSVGSSFAATMSGITEVNPLPPHYICPKCKHSDFDIEGDYDCGVDLPNKNCPVCGEPYIKEGFNIPFEVFLGFKGDKEPDIDLNFAGEYQPVAHKYIEELFGKNHVFRAGTIGTVAAKTAYGYVMKYYEEKGEKISKWEVGRLAKGCEGVKRTTGQHPGGIIVVPKENDIHEFCPVQHPADDSSNDIITTHFDYHSIDANLLKLDILGHDGPSIIKMLYDITGVDPNTVPLKDEKVDLLFTGITSLDLKDDRFTADKGSLGIPEFGTKFVRQMLEDTKPKSFADLVRIAGLSHGTDVWLNNAQEFILNGTTELSGVISVRDDILNYLQKMGVESSVAFKIMEDVRKGKGVKEEYAEVMMENGVPEWYLESCRRIQYMFPKAHAVAYVMMSYRIAYFKIYYPLAFYASYFTMKVSDFNSEVILKGIDAILERMSLIESKGKSAGQKELTELPVLELALEMYCRGYEFMPVSLEISDAEKFKVVDNKVLLPFAALSGVGENAAKALFKEVKNGPFLSIDELRKRTKLNKTAIEALEESGVLKGIPKSDQLSFF